MNIDELYVKLCVAVVDGLRFISDNEEDFFRYNLSNYYSEYPDLRYDETGYPSFSKAAFAKKNYLGLLMKDGFCKNLASWQEVQNYLFSDEGYRKYFFLKEYSDFKNGIWDDYHSIFIISNLIDRYIHIYSSKDFIDEKFHPLFMEWSSFFTSAKLNFDIIIPILMVTFDFDELEINSLVRVKRMDDLFQKSRNTQKSINSSPHERVICCATHAFILNNYSLDNESNKSYYSLYETNGYQTVLADINKLFAYLRNRTGVETGYCQLIARPSNWASSWSADLLPLMVASTKAYPDYFEDFYWVNLPSKFSSDIFIPEEIEKYLKPIQRNVQVAIDRLNNAFLRRHRRFNS